MLEVRHGDLSDRIEARNLGKDTDLNLFMSVDENIVVDGNGNNCFTKLSTFNNTKEENASMFQQDTSISLLTTTALIVCEEKAPDLLGLATEMQKKHSRLFTSFSKCHREYNSMKVFTEHDIDHLGKSQVNCVENRLCVYNKW